MQKEKEKNKRSSVFLSKCTPPPSKKKRQKKNTPSLPKEKKKWEYIYMYVSLWLVWGFEWIESLKQVESIEPSRNQVHVNVRNFKK